ncbi:MAG: rhodanese-like domain-containing protein [Roseobacter sp.]
MPGLLIRRSATFLAALLGAAIFLLLATTTVFADTRTITAPDALAASDRGDIIILDIRSPSEWAETGVAKGALPVTMHSPEFGANLSAIINQSQGKPIALICATGGRSSYVASVLGENGLTNVIDVSEGMFGNDTAKGWIARGLPIVDVQTAMSAQSVLNLE